MNRMARSLIDDPDSFRTAARRRGCETAKRRRGETAKTAMRVMDLPWQAQEKGAKRSGYANHICHPPSGHQILYVLGGLFFDGSWQAVLFKLHIFLR
jgi:hypothetical protein